MNFTITNCVEHVYIYWYVDDQIYDLLYEEVDDLVRWDVIEQVESQVERQVYVHHNPIQNKIKREIEK